MPRRRRPLAPPRPSSEVSRYGRRPAAPPCSPSPRHCMGMRAWGGLTVGGIHSSCCIAVFLRRICRAERDACAPAGMCVHAHVGVCRRLEHVDARACLKLTCARADRESQAVTAAIGMDEQISAEKVTPNVACDPNKPPWLVWRRGVQLPPFSCENPEALSLIRRILGAPMNVQLPQIQPLSEAVGMQLYGLVFDRASRPTGLDVGFRGLYVVLASLARGCRVPDPSPAAVSRLRQFFDRRQSGGGRAPGLAVAFKHMLRNRKNDEELRQLEATAVYAELLRRWDLSPIAFEWSAAGGGGGDDPNGVSSVQMVDEGDSERIGAHACPPALAPFPVCFV